MDRRRFLSSVSLLAALCVLLLAAAGCSIGDYTYVNLPVRASWERSLLHGSIGSDQVLTSSLGRGGELRVWLDLALLPRDLEPESIARATLKLPCKSFSRVPGTVAFEIYMVMWSYDPGTGEWPDTPGFVSLHELPYDDNPLSSARLSHDAGWETRQSNGYTYRFQYIDTDVKYLSFDITEAIRAWVSGTPNMGLRVKQKSPVKTDGPTWSVLMGPDERLSEILKMMNERPKSAAKDRPDRIEQPIAIVCIKKAEDAPPES